MSALSERSRARCPSGVEDNQILNEAQADESKNQRTEVGTGISRIRDAVRENGKSTVEFSFNEFFTVTYHRSRKEPDDGLTDSEKTTQKSSQKTTQKNEGLSETREKTSEKMSEKTSEKTSEKILNIISTNSGITIHELSIRIGITPRSVERSLKKLQNTGQLKRIGPDKGGHWKVLKKDGK